MSLSCMPAESSKKETVHEIFKDPRHPYTIGLMNSKPVVGRKVDRLYSIPGNVPNPVDMPDYCYFRDRCDQCTAKCDGAYRPKYVFRRHTVFHVNLYEGEV